MKSLKIFVLLFLFVFSGSLICQETAPGSPLRPGKVIIPFHLGVFGGINFPLQPKELTAIPSSGALSKAQNSLMNGFDGLGFAGTYIFGISGRYPLSPNFFIGPDISFSGWKSQISCDCSGINFWKSENSLSNFSIAVVPQYYFYGNFYVSPEINLNFLGVHSTENDSIRGKTDFSKTYTRIGAGLALGYEYYFGRTGLSLSAKAISPNLLLKQTNSQNWTESNSVINSGTSLNESTLLFFSLNLGLIFQISEINKEN